MAAALGLSGFKVLVIDLDPQCYLTRANGINEADETATASALFIPKVRFSDLTFIRRSGYDLLPGSVELTKLVRRMSRPTDVLWLREKLLEDKNAVDYHFILVDTSAALTVLNINALVVSNLAIIPVAPEFQAVSGAEQTLSNVRHLRHRLRLSNPMCRFLITQFDKRKRTHREYTHYICKKYSKHVFDVHIRTNAPLSDARGDGATVFDVAPRSRGAVDYAAATDELVRWLNASTQDPMFA